VFSDNPKVYEKQWRAAELAAGRDANICRRDLEAEESADYVIAELSDPSRGASGEVYYALYKAKKPCLMVYKKGTLESAMFLQNEHPLLTVGEYETHSGLEKHIDDFFYFPEQQGRIFTIDGGDGGGKETQTRLLVERLQKDGYPVKTLDFPHDTALYGGLIRELLAGKHGSLKEVNPLFFASLYAANRHDMKPIIDYWISKGQNVILDRYVEANWGHQASKLHTDDERHKVIHELQTLEWDWLGLPKSYKVLYLDLPIDYAETAMKNDEKRVMDIHEKDISYKEQVRRTFLWCAREFKNWQVFDCLNPQGKRYTPEELHEQIYNKLRPELVNQGDERLIF
ncbi:MAG: hypothetical protein V1743_06330, partial [Nanoarchaeota archaeon]